MKTGGGAGERTLAQEPWSTLIFQKNSLYIDSGLGSGDTPNNPPPKKNWAGVRIE